MLPAITDAIAMTPVRRKMVNKTYRLSEKYINGYLDELDAVRQAVEKILSTERGAYEIYDPSFGVRFERYIGKSIGYLQSTIQDELNTALLQDDRITSVVVRSIETVDMVSVAIIIDVYTTVGVLSGIGVHLNV